MASIQADVREPELLVGGIYATYNAEKGHFRVVKLLAIDDVGVHIRMFDPTFSEPPDESVLGILRSRIGHAPVGRRNFSHWSPALIAVQEVGDDELDGYRHWQKAKGGYFGT